MIEMWAVLGLSCIDKRFREGIIDRVDEEEELFEYLVKENHFRLSRFELGEIQRLFRKPEIRECLGEIESKGWGRICPTGHTFNPDYHHDQYIAENGGPANAPA